MRNGTITIINNLIKKAFEKRDDRTISTMLWKEARPYINGRMDAALEDKDYHRYLAGHAYKIVRDDVQRIVEGEEFIDEIIKRIKRKQL